MRLDRLDGLIAFISVAERQSFTAAAAELDVTPSAISQAVSQLEQRLGVRLLNRTTRRVGLTEAGTDLFNRSRPALRELSEAADALNAFRDRPRGLLRITAPGIAWQALLLPRLPGFFAAYPEIQLEIDMDDGLTDLVSRGLDAGIRLGEVLERDMVARPFGGPLRIALAASPAYLAQRGMPTSPADLAEHDCIRYRFRTQGGVYRWELLEQGKIVQVAISGSLTINSGLAMTDAALAGMGIAYLTTDLTAPHFATGRLMPVLEPHWPSFPGFHLYYPSRRQLAPKLQAFADYFLNPAMAGQPT